MALAGELRGWRHAFSDVDLSLDVVGELDDSVVGEWRLVATHSGPLEVAGNHRVDPTGRRIDLRGVMVAEFEGDRIKRFRQYWDEVTLLEGLGLLPRNDGWLPAPRDAGRRLARKARVLLLAEGFTNERIDELAAAFARDHPEENVDDFVAWALGEGVLG